MILCICHCHVGLGYLRIPLGYNNKYVFNSEARLFVQTIKIIPLGYIYQFEWGVLRWRVIFFFFFLVWLLFELPLYTCFFQMDWSHWRCPQIKNFHLEFVYAIRTSYLNSSWAKVFEEMLGPNAIDWVSLNFLF